MFIFNQLKRVNINYPLLIGNKFLKEDKYKELKNNWPNFRDYKTINAGQTYRKNIEIIEGNANY